MTKASRARRRFNRAAEHPPFLFVNRLAENITLASESFRSGKIGLLVFNTVRRDLVDARLDYLDALADVAERRYALQLAIGGTLE